MIMTVSLATYNENNMSYVRAVMPTGAPFNVILPVGVVGNPIAGGANALFIPTGAVESLPSEVAVPDPVVSIASLPGLPGNHTGYVIRDADAEEQAQFAPAHLPAFSIADAYGSERDVGASGEHDVPYGEIVFTITLSRALTSEEGHARVQYYTSVESGQTATAGEDFATTEGWMLFPPGTTEQTFSVPIFHDNPTEEPETFTVTLSDPTPNTRLDENRKSAVGYILDTYEIPIPRLIIGDATAREDSGMIEFTIRANMPVSYESRVQYSTSVENGQTATAGVDFTSVTGETATIAAGTTSTTVSIAVVNDTEEEPDETFTVTLSDPSSDGLYTSIPLRSTAVGTIVDDDGDGVGPDLVSAAVDGATLTLTYDEALDEASAPDRRAYTVHVDGGAWPAPVAVEISGSEVTLTLPAAVNVGQVVTLSYVVPAANPVQDPAGNKAAGLTDLHVNNITADTTAPEV